MIEYITDPTLMISGIAATYSLAYRYLTQKFGNRERVKEIQKTFNDLNKEFSEASKKNDQQKVQQIMKKQQEAMPMLTESMILQFKPMLFVLPVLLIIPPILRDHFTSFVIQLPFSIPVFIQHFEKFPNWRDTFGPVGWFFISIFIIQIILTILLGAYSKLKGKKQ